MRRSPVPSAWPLGLLAGALLVVASACQTLLHFTAETREAIPADAALADALKGASDAELPETASDAGADGSSTLVDGSSLDGACVQGFFHEPFAGTWSTSFVVVGGEPTLEYRAGDQVLQVDLDQVQGSGLQRPIGLDGGSVSLRLEVDCAKEAGASYVSAASVVFAQGKRLRIGCHRNPSNHLTLAWFPGSDADVPLSNSSATVVTIDMTAGSPTLRVAWNDVQPFVVIAPEAIDLDGALLELGCGGNVFCRAPALVVVNDVRLCAK